VPHIPVPGTELHYERAGQGEPLLLIQGMSANRLAWGPPFFDLVENSFECISFDNRGTGLSSPATEPFSIAEMAMDAVDLLDALEIQSAHVFGVSMGGMIAQELALGHPERIRTLTLGCTYCGGPGSRLMDPDDFHPLVEALAACDEQLGLRLMWEMNLSPGFRAVKGRHAEFSALSEARPIRQPTIALQLQAIGNHDTSERLYEISAPTLIVHGTDDRILPVENALLLSLGIPSARLELLDGMAHMFWWEDPARAVELLRDHALVASRA
jgi:3-oxoadipate enol-lactonase